MARKVFGAYSGVVVNVELEGFLTKVYSDVFTGFLHSNGGVEGTSPDIFECGSCIYVNLAVDHRLAWSVDT